MQSREARSIGWITFFADFVNVDTKVDGAPDHREQTNSYEHSKENFVHDEHHF
jgi:hypothetical protein